MRGLQAVGGVWVSSCAAWRRTAETEAESTTIWSASLKASIWPLRENRGVGVVGGEQARIRGTSEAGHPFTCSTCVYSTMF